MTVDRRQSSGREGITRNAGEHLDHKQAILLFRWLLIFVVVAFVILTKNDSSALSTGFPLAALFILTNVALSLLPSRLFTGLSLVGPMLIVDISFVTAAIYVSGSASGDVYLLYFLTIFLAALSRDIKISVMASVAVILLYVLMSSWAMKGEELLSTTFMIKIPFFLLTALFSGFLASQAKHREKETAEATRSNVRLQEALQRSKRSEERAREELLSLHQHNQNILESISTAVMVIDATYVITTFNHEATRITGVVKNSVIGKSLHGLPELSAFASLLTKVIRSGDTCSRAELTFEATGGRTLAVGVSTSVLRDPQFEPRGAIAIFKDLTQLKELERKLQRSERLALLGEMAASMAQEIRNPLNSISGLAQLIGEKTDEQDRRKFFSQTIVEESRRIETIIADILLFSRDATRKLDPVDMNDVVSSCATRLNEKARGADVSISLDLDPDLPLVQGNSSQLQQVFNNLIVNAIQAMPDGGDVLISTSTSNDSVVAVVSDTGPGMSAETADAVFHPFFTTKSGGTGLGLSACSKIAEDHRGSIEVESGPGRGASFRVTIPALRAEQEVPRQSPTSAPAV